jgi:hypothetical protein
MSIRTVVLMLLFQAALIPAHAAVDSIFIVPGSHLDIGFTDLPSAIVKQRVVIMDDAIESMKRDADFRWVEEGGFVVEAWMKAHKKDAAKLAVLKHFVRNGQFSIGATYLTPHTGVIPELQRWLAPHLPMVEKTFGVRPTVAILNDVPSHPQSIIDPLVANGVKYLLVGANLNFSNALPKAISRAPFYWESETGKRLLVFVDPDGYFGTVQQYGLGPECAKAYNPKKFPQSMHPLQVMNTGVNDLLLNSTDKYDALVLQHSLDNWNAGCARELLEHLKQWNAQHMRPALKMAGPEDYFRHIEEKYRTTIPVYKAEWGAQWDEIRAVSPVWTWRLREAAKRIGKAASHDAQAYMLLAMDHNVHLGEIWPRFFSLDGAKTYAKECTQYSIDALRAAKATDLLNAVPPLPKIPPGTTRSEAWSALLAGDPFRVRCGTWINTPFVAPDAPLYANQVKYGVEGSRIVGSVHVDRLHLPGQESGNVAVAVEIPLRAPMSKIRIAAEESPEGRRGKYLRSPQFIVCADGLRVVVNGKQITVRSPLIYSWVLVADQRDKNLTWLQGMICRQTLLCQLKGGQNTTMPYDGWFPGEPAQIDVPVRMELR